MKYTFALLLGLGTMLGATAQAAPRLGDATALKSEATASALKQNVWHRRAYYGSGYGYGRPWVRDYHRRYWGGSYPPYGAGYYPPYGVGYYSPDYRPFWGGYYRPWGYRQDGWGYDD